jgi:hypothetical protein
MFYNLRGKGEDFSSNYYTRTCIAQKCRSTNANSFSTNIQWVEKLSVHLLNFFLSFIFCLIETNLGASISSILSVLELKLFFKKLISYNF